MSWSLSKFIRDNKRTYPKRTTKDHTMKFTDLTSSSRSLLAALCAAGAAGLRTDALGRCITPRRATPPEAADMLNSMRQLGLVYSQQKAPNAAYSLWKASEYGMAVFMGRPEDVPATEVSQGGDTEDRKPPRPRLWMVYPGSMQFRGTEDALAATLAKCAEESPGTKYLAYVLHSEAVLPVPKAQITLL